MINNYKKINATNQTKDLIRQINNRAMCKLDFKIHNNYIEILNHIGGSRQHRIRHSGWRIVIIQYHCNNTKSNHLYSCIYLYITSTSNPPLQTSDPRPLSSVRSLLFDQKVNRIESLITYITHIKPLSSLRLFMFK